MKRQEKLDLLCSAITNIQICRCYYTYDENYYYYYPNAVNEKFFLGQEENDFLLDGYHIRKISQLKKVEIKDDKCNEINKLNGLTNEINMPDVDITSWQTIFNSLKKLDTFVIIEDAIGEKYEIGIIEKVFNNKLYFRCFDADGNWDEDTIIIPYSTITNVAWNTRYTKNWEKYMRKDTLSLT